VLAPHGRLVTFDGCYVKGQSTMARGLLAADRGGYVRDAAAYRELAVPHFSAVRAELRHDLLRIPYTHVIMQAEHPVSLS